MQREMKPNKDIKILERSQKSKVIKAYTAPGEGDDFPCHCLFKTEDRQTNLSLFLEFTFPPGRVFVFKLLDRVIDLFVD